MAGLLLIISINMKNIILIPLITFLFLSCGTSKPTVIYFASDSTKSSQEPRVDIEIGLNATSTNTRPNYTSIGMLSDSSIFIHGDTLEAIKMLWIEYKKQTQKRLEAEYFIDSLFKRKRDTSNHFKIWNDSVSGTGIKLSKYKD